MEKSLPSRPPYRFYKPHPKTPTLHCERARLAEAPGYVVSAFSFFPDRKPAMFNPFLRRHFAERRLGYWHLRLAKVWRSRVSSPVWLHVAQSILIRCIFVTVANCSVANQNFLWPPRKYNTCRSQRHFGDESVCAASKITINNRPEQWYALGFLYISITQSLFFLLFNTNRIHVRLWMMVYCAIHHISQHIIPDIINECAWWILINAAMVLATSRRVTLLRKNIALQLARGSVQVRSYRTMNRTVPAATTTSNGGSTVLFGYNTISMMPI